MTGPPAEPILIAEYDAAWPERFAEERAHLERALAGCDGVLAIEHVGSTAVPGLAAKPVIDIMIGVRDFTAAVPCITPIIGLDYECRGEAGIPDRIYFRKGAPRSHHIHLVVHGSKFWDRHLRFRDALRARPDVAAAYAELKRRLAAKYGRDRIGYTDAKSPFIEGVLGGAPVQ